MKILNYIIIIATIAVNSFSQEKLSTSAEHYKTKSFEVAIFPKTNLDILLDNKFTPNKSQIDLAELALKTDIKALNVGLSNQNSTPIIHKNLKKYKRQYFGYVDANGDQILFINAIWHKSVDKNNWLNQYLGHLDGGSYYWQIKFNLSKNKMFDLSVNGYA